MDACTHCGGRVEGRFRYCPWCGTALRRKFVEFFPGHARDEGKALRVSRYVTEDPQVRFSVWDQSGRVEAAVSVNEFEAGRLARFLRHPVRRKTLRDYAAELSPRRSSTGSRKTTSS